jgi:4,5-DOPA dioxygenase extradiol
MGYSTGTIQKELNWKTRQKTMQEQTPKTIRDTFPNSDQVMPALFIGHGSPMNAIEDNEFSRVWAEIGKTLPKPRAILCISAHWETSGTQVTAMELPETIHDFGGFPRQLYEMVYQAPGSPTLAHLVQNSVSTTAVGLDFQWGFDHGAWSVLARLFPDASIPVVQLSLDRTQEPAYHYQLGKALRPLRNQGVLILASGNIVHNLRLAFIQEHPFDWAVEFDETLRQIILTQNHEGAIHYQSLGKAAALSVPTNEHYLPFLYALAVQDEGEELRFFTEKVTYGSLSMRSFQLG